MIWKFLFCVWLLPNMIIEGQKQNIKYWWDLRFSQWCRQRFQSSRIWDHVAWYRALLYSEDGGSSLLQNMCAYTPIHPVHIPEDWNLYVIFIQNNSSAIYPTMYTNFILNIPVYKHQWTDKNAKLKPLSQWPHSTPVFIKTYSTKYLSRCVTIQSLSFYREHHPLSHFPGSADTGSETVWQCDGL